MKYTLSTKNLSVKCTRIFSPLFTLFVRQTLIIFLSLACLYHICAITSFFSYFPASPLQLQVKPPPSPFSQVIVSFSIVDIAFKVTPSFSSLTHVGKGQCLYSSYFMEQCNQALPSPFNVAIVRPKSDKSQRLSPPL